MAKDLHTISLMAGSTTSLADRLRVGLLTNVAVAAIIGGITGVVITNPGAYAAIPTVTCADGSGATFTPSMMAASIVLAAAGGSSTHSYVPADTITTTGGTAGQQVIMEVNSTQVSSATIGGTMTGYVIGDQVTLNAVGGTQIAPVVIQVATLTGSAIATFTIVNGGELSANATSYVQVSTTGVGTGATLTSPIFGVKAFTVKDAGLFTALPSNPVAQGSSSGSGLSATFTITWGVSKVVASGGINYKDGSALSFTGAGGAAGFVEVNPLEGEVTIHFAGQFPANLKYNVQVTPNAPSYYSVSNKTAQGFDVTFYPRSATESVLATQFDVLVLA